VISFYASSFHALGVGSPSARWAHLHPWKARILLTVLLLVYFNVVCSSGSARLLASPEGTEFTDSHGVPIERFATINVNAGDIWSPGR
jgi:hypothetical protein